MSILDRNVFAREFASTDAEQIVYAYPLMADRLRDGNVLRLKIVGDVLNNTGGESAPTFKVTVGETELMRYAPNLRSDVDRRFVALDVEIVGGDRESTGQCTLTVCDPAPRGPQMASVERRPTFIVHFSSPLSGESAFVVTVQHDRASEALSYGFRTAFLEHIG